MRAITVLLLAAVFAAASDTVLVLETSPGMERWLGQTTLPRLALGDAMAIVTFSGKPKLRQALTDDQARLEYVLQTIRKGRTSYGIVGRRAPGKDARVYAAIAEAARVLGSNGGRIVLLFGSEEREGKPAPAELQRALAASHIRLDVAAVRRAFPIGPPARQAQTPPTVPGRYPPVDHESMPLPEATLEVLKGLCRASGGESVTGRWDLRAVMATLPARG
jgi:hypothetical protein